MILSLVISIRLLRASIINIFLYQIKVLRHKNSTLTAGMVSLWLIVQTLVGKGLVAPPRPIPTVSGH